MKKKLLLLILISMIITIIIYYHTKKDNINILSLGDSVSFGMTPYEIEGYSFNDYLKEHYKIKKDLGTYIGYGSENITIKEMLNGISNNDTIFINEKEERIKHTINEADIITISIGRDELRIKGLSNKKRKEFINDLDTLLNEIKKLNNKKVFVIGIFRNKNEDALSISKLNASIRDITNKYNYIFIDIKDILNKDEYFLDKEWNYLNGSGEYLIYKEIKKYL